MYRLISRQRNDSAAAWRDLPRPDYVDAPLARASTVDGVQTWYSPALLTASMVGARSMRAATARAILALYERMESDAYVETLRTYYASGLRTYGDEWQYSDLVTALHAATELIKPAAYLEIGVRRGRSMAAVGALAPDCHLVGFDTWTANYAGMENPGELFVRDEMRRIGHTGRLELISGDSHQTVPAYFDQNPNAWFDLITVDGDHSLRGAAADLACVLPRLRIGGAILFDDIVHPKHPELGELWRRVCADGRLSHWEYVDLGYGLGIGVRKF